MATTVAHCGPFGEDRAEMGLETCSLRAANLLNAGRHLRG